MQGFDGWKWSAIRKRLKSCFFVCGLTNRSFTLFYMLFLWEYSVTGPLSFQGIFQKWTDEHCWFRSNPFWPRKVSNDVLNTLKYFGPLLWWLQFLWPKVFPVCRTIGHRSHPKASIKSAYFTYIIRALELLTQSLRWFHWKMLNLCFRNKVDA